MDGPRKLRRELVLGRRPHEVDLRHEHVLLDEHLRGPPDQRRFAVAARSEDDDVLAVAGVRHEAVDLGPAVREGVVEGEGAEAEGIDGVVFGHDDIMAYDIMGVRIVSRTTASKAGTAARVAVPLLA